MAVKTKVLIEAARAATLASHSASSLMATAQQREAGRLLRSAEALARAATAVLLAHEGRDSHREEGVDARAVHSPFPRERRRPAPGSGHQAASTHGQTTPHTEKKKRNRRRRPKEEQKELEVNEKKEVVMKESKNTGARSSTGSVPARATPAPVLPPASRFL